MELHLKPITWAEYIEKEFPDWVFYETGQFAKPLCILRDGDVKKIVDEYCAYHKIKIDL